MSTSSGTHPRKGQLVAVSESRQKFGIQIEAIKTPKGMVPTVDTIKRVVQGLNLLDADLTRTKLKMEANIRALLREVKTLQKLVADDTIASESSLERLGEIIKRLDKMEKSMNSLASTPVEAPPPDALVEAMRKEISPALTQAVQRLEEALTLFETRMEEFLRELQTSILIAIRQASSPARSQARKKARGQTT